MGFPSKPKVYFQYIETQTNFETFSESLEAEVALINTCTHPSSPVTFIDLPEATSVTSEFFYNFYTRDERTVETDDISRIEVGDGDQSVEYMKRNSRSPRNVILRVSTPANPDASKTLIDLAAQNKYVPSRYQDKIVFEGAVANQRFSSLILKDNKVDRTFYEQLQESITFDDSYSKSNNQSQFMQNLSTLFESPLATATQTTNTIKKALANVQPKGVAYAPTDTRFEVVAEALRDVNFVEFNMTVSNAVCNNVLLGSLEDRGNIYQDELMSVKQDARKIQDIYVAEARGFEILSSEYDLELAPIAAFTQQARPEIDEGAVPVGFYIEKSEITTDPLDNTLPITRDLEPIIVDRYGPLTIFDPNVRYGATYVYTVKIIYLVSYEANAVDPDGLTDDEIVFAISLIASEGVKTQVACIERIPPPPPRNLSFNYNFQKNTLDLYWEEPTNPQRDIVRYQIFRRKTINDSYTLVAEYDFDYSTSKVQPLEVAPADKLYRVSGPKKSFRDTTFKRSDEYIYALASIDARGLTSGYSEQIHVKFNIYDNKIVTKRISDPNAPKSYPNLYLKNDFFVDVMASSEASRMRVFFDPEYYDVVKTSYPGSSTGEKGPSDKDGGGKGTISKAAAKSPKKVDQSLNLIGRKYKIQIINLDLQNQEIFDINISDQTGEVQEVPLGQAEIKTVIL